MSSGNLSCSVTDLSSQSLICLHCLLISRQDVQQQTFPPSSAAFRRKCECLPRWPCHDAIPPNVHSLTQPQQQHVRRYATEPPKSGGSGAGLYGAIGAAALGGGYWYMNQGAQPASQTQEQNIPAKAAPNAPKTFTGGDQGFIPLVLDSTEQVSHNTKKLRFKLSSEDAVAGLPVASALITKYKGPEMQKPVIRPYTPISDEGKWQSHLSRQTHI